MNIFTDEQTTINKLLANTNNNELTGKTIIKETEK